MVPGENSEKVKTPDKLILHQSSGRPPQSQRLQDSM